MRVNVGLLQMDSWWLGQIQWADGPVSVLYLSVTIRDQCWEIVLNCVQKGSFSALCFLHGYVVHKYRGHWVDAVMSKAMQQFE